MIDHNSGDVSTTEKETPQQVNASSQKIKKQDTLDSQGKQSQGKETPQQVNASSQKIKKQDTLDSQGKQSQGKETPQQVNASSQKIKKQDTLDSQGKQSQGKDSMLTEELHDDKGIEISAVLEADAGTDGDETSRADTSFVGGEIFKTLGEVAEIEETDTQWTTMRNTDSEVDASQRKSLQYMEDSEVDTSVQVSSRLGSANTTASSKKGSKRFQRRSSMFKSVDKREKSNEVDKAKSTSERTSAQRRGSTFKVKPGSGKSRNRTSRETSKVARTGTLKDTTQKKENKEDIDADDGSTDDHTLMVKKVLALVNSMEDEPCDKDSAYLDKIQDKLQDIYNSLATMPKKPAPSVNEEGSY